MTKEEIKEKILAYGSDSLWVFGGRYEGGINLQQVPHEITELFNFLQSTNTKFENFLEVGCAAGGNTFAFNDFFNFSNVVLIDDNNHPKHTLRKDILKNVKYTEFVGNSQSVEAKSFVEFLDIKFDLMVIDADHSYQGVKNDTQNFIEFLNKGGYLIFHDTEICDGVKAWSNELKNGFLKDIEFVANYVNHERPLCGLGIFKKL